MASGKANSTDTGTAGDGRSVLSLPPEGALSLADGGIMRAKISETGADRRQGRAIAAADCHESGTTMVHALGAAAWIEARAILREVEQGTEGKVPDAIHFPARYMSQRTLTHGTLLSLAQAALAESLAAFLED